MSEGTGKAAETRRDEQLWWPHAGLQVAKSRGSARKLATEVVERNGPLLPSAIVAYFGFHLTFKELRAREGGLEALLIPSDRYKFNLVVDPWSGGDENAVEFRIGHELGHTFFFNWKPNITGAPERSTYRHITLGNPETDPEEVFCDAFAEGLMEPFTAVTIEPR